MERIEASRLGAKHCLENGTNHWVLEGRQKQYQYNLNPKICPNCKIKIDYFSRENTFCSRRCSAQHFNKINKTHNRLKQRKCQICDKIFIPDSSSVSKIKCNNCKGPSAKEKKLKLQNKTIEEYYSTIKWKAKHPQYKWNHIRILCKRWNSNLRLQPCQVCKYSKHIELAHIKAVSSFKETVTLGEINHPNNILCLCPNHHWEFDKELLKLENIPSR